MKEKTIVKYQESLQQLGIIREEDFVLFSENIKFRTVTKDEILLGEGEICQSVFFINSGAIYQYGVKDEIEQNVIDLHIEGEWLLNHKSFIAQKPSENIIQAYTDSSLWELTLENLHKLIGQSPAFFLLGKLLEPSNSRITFFDNDSTPIQKYEHILQTRPQLLQVFPLRIIASYLKITPETLSRVRAKLAKEKRIS
jgi:CRP-like cAMP-binding protein